MLKSRCNLHDRSCLRSLRLGFYGVAPFHGFPAVVWAACGVYLLPLLRLNGTQTPQGRSPLTTLSKARAVHWYFKHFQASRVFERKEQVSERPGSEVQSKYSNLLFFALQGVNQMRHRIRALQDQAGWRLSASNHASKIISLWWRGKKSVVYRYMVSWLHRGAISLTGLTTLF